MQYSGNLLQCSVKLNECVKPGSLEEHNWASSMLGRTQVTILSCNQETEMNEKPVTKGREGPAKTANYKVPRPHPPLTLMRTAAGKAVSLQPPQHQPRGVSRVLECPSLLAYASPGSLRDTTKHLCTHFFSI